MFRAAVVQGVIGAVLLTGCNSTMMDSEPATQLLSVSPRGGETGVAPTADLVLGFNRPMMAGMEQYLALHQGGITGATMAMTCGWSSDQTMLTCRPNQQLSPGSRFTIHVGGGMMASDGQSMGMGRYGPIMGGQWATRGMMGDQSSMMGAGWQCCGGTYGMVFEFTTR